MIADVENDCQSVVSQQEAEERVWDILHLVEIDSFIQQSLERHLHVPVDNRLGGSQSIEQSSVTLELSINSRETTSRFTKRAVFRIMFDKVRWFRSKVFSCLLTFHNDHRRESLPDHILHIELD